MRGSAKHRLNVAVTASGLISFCYSYSINGQQETVPFRLALVLPSLWLKPVSSGVTPRKWLQRGVSAQGQGMRQGASQECRDVRRLG